MSIPRIKMMMKFYRNFNGFLKFKKSFVEFRQIFNECFGFYVFDMKLEIQ
jgi:hypothetical protein